MYSYYTNKVFGLAVAVIFQYWCKQHVVIETLTTSLNILVVSLKNTPVCHV